MPAIFKMIVFNIKDVSKLFLSLKQLCMEKLFAIIIIVTSQSKNKFRECDDKIANYEIFLGNDRL